MQKKYYLCVVHKVLQIILNLVDESLVKDTAFNTTSNGDEFS